jgi:glycosyltransferase involved in cell wall biosynthesis
MRGVSSALRPQDPERAAATAQRFGTTGPFLVLLDVGTRERRKNLVGLIVVPDRGYRTRNAEELRRGAGLRVRRRVLNVIESLGAGGGGAERLLTTTHYHLDQSRFEPAVAVLFGPNPGAEDFRRLGIPVYELHLSGPRDLPQGILRLRRLIRSEKFDIVHTHLYYANVAGRLAAWGLAHVVTTLHGLDYTYEDPGTLLFRGKKLVDRLTGNWLNELLLAVSGEARRDFERHLGFSGIRVLPNYIDVETLQRRLDRLDRQALRKELSLGQRDVAILHVGRIHPSKGQDLLLEALARARREVPELVLFLVGFFEEKGGLRQALEERARQANLVHAVRITGPVRDVTPYFRAADVFAFPSRYEAFGLALLEAMAAGLATVASRAGGILELATEETALLVPVGDVAALAEGLVSLATDPARRRRLGTAARERAKPFDVRVHVRRLEDLYASL